MAVYHTSVYPLSTNSLTNAGYFRCRLQPLEIMALLVHQQNIIVFLSSTPTLAMRDMRYANNETQS
jgi:hypothetical protein